MCCMLVGGRIFSSLTGSLWTSLKTDKRRNHKPLRTIEGLGTAGFYATLSSTPPHHFYPYLADPKQGFMSHPVPTYQAVSYGPLGAFVNAAVVVLGTAYAAHGAIEATTTLLRHHPLLCDKQYEESNRVTHTVIILPPEECTPELGWREGCCRA